jgi:hypothetical protein
MDELPSTDSGLWCWVHRKMMGLMKKSDHSEDDDHPRLTLLVSDSPYRMMWRWVPPIPQHGGYVNWLSSSVFLLPWLSWVLNGVWLGLDTLGWVIRSSWYKFDDIAVSGRCCTGPTAMWMYWRGIFFSRVSRINSLPVYTRYSVQ